MSAIEQAVADTIRRYREACTAGGVDPDVELTEVALAGDTPVPVWVAWRSLNAAAIREVPGRRPVTVGDVLQLAAGLPDTFPELNAAITGVLATLVTVDASVYDLFAATTTDVMVLDELVELGYARAVSGNPAASPETLAELAASGDSGVRANVADNASTPREALALLARDAHPWNARRARSRLAGFDARGV